MKRHSMKFPPHHDPVSARMYKLFHAPDYSLVRYSVGHFADFVRGMLVRYIHL